ncbi:MAG: hypothetical protein ACKO9H_02465, partial [Planctomycetota bacterium]
VVANKVDLPGAEVEAGELPVSARTGAGLTQFQSALVQRVLPSAVVLREPLPVAGPLLQFLAEMRAAGKQADWSTVERVYERLAEYCGRRNGR